MFPLFNSSKQIKRLCYYFFIFLCLFFVLLPKKIGAEEPYQVKYNAEYFPDLKGNAQVKLNIKITNLRSDVYVKEFALSFPSSFMIENIDAYDDNGKIPAAMETMERNFKIKLSFSSPNVGKNSENNLHLNFLQKNLFKVKNTIWEVFLPALPSNENSVFNTVVHLPSGLDKRLSIAKPKPTLIRNNTIYWNEVKTKMIYAVFGESQTYQVNLLYNLQNEKIYPVYYLIAFPPETLYQKVIVESIEPPPEETSIDEDGNYLGRYTLKSKEKRQIIFKGFIQVLTKPQPEMAEFIKKNFARQSQYLLSPQPYWSLNKEILENNQIKPLKTAEDIYNFTVDKLNYNYKRVNKNLQRIGANEILGQPDNAVCMEFTDLFIALAREKGIFTREINGYGFSDDPNLRPLSLLSDMLHAWPEYFDQKTQIWQPIDPTWEDTSGIDYFTALDLNHITFVIHGKNSSFPLSAGMYKINDSKDIDVEIASITPKEKIDLKWEDDIKNEIFDREKYRAKITLTNNSNVFIKNYQLEIKSAFLKISPEKIRIDLLAPYQIFQQEIEYSSVIKNINKKDAIIINFNERPLRQKEIKIISFYWNMFYKSLGAFLGFSVLLIVYLSLKRVKNKY